MTAPAVARPLLDQFDDPHGRLCYRFTLPGCTTKKTSNRIIRVKRHGKEVPMILPAQKWLAWRELCRGYVTTKPQLTLALSAPVNCRALFYRQANRGDATGYYQALADILEDAGVILNDRQIVSWDGSRLLKDAVRPRVEVTLTVLGDTQMEIGA